MTKKTIDDLPNMNFMIGSYRGEINEDNIPHGFGMLRTMFDEYTKATISGTFEDGFLSEGTAFYFILDPNNPKKATHDNEYHGKFNFQFQFHGEGKQIERHIENEREQRFNGNFINGFKHGTGVLENYEGETIKGTWIRDTYYDFKDDEPIYFGDRKESGLFHGQGTLVFSDGSTAVGEWKDNQLYSGIRTFYNNGVIITNNIEEGIVMAQYQMSWPNSQWYVGETKNDEFNASFHGRGILGLPNGSVEAGIWEEGNLVEVENELVEKAKKDISEQYNQRKKRWEIRTP